QKRAKEWLVGTFLVMKGQARQQCEGGALLELGLAARPLLHLAPGVRRAVEQVKTGMIADRPAIEILAPAIHLRWRDAPRLVNEARKHPRLEPLRIPECGGQLVIAPEALAQVAQNADRDAERMIRWNREARHPVADPLAAEAIQRSDDCVHFAIRPCALSFRH